MIRPQYFYDILKSYGIDFYTGVPDSLLKSLCAYLTENSESTKNIIAANEGGAIGLAAGHYLATKEIPVVYMQNSGIGNAVNPLLSLTDEDVYRIPILLIVGWRGEPNIHDEPQHVKQGKITIPLFDIMGIKNEILATEEQDINEQIKRAVDYMQEKQTPYALIVKKGTFEKYKLSEKTEKHLELEREKAVQLVASALDDNSVVVSTTGKISRELFEYREMKGENHEHDFLTVGSMGHSSQIALGIALAQEDRKIYCFDGDGAIIMHMGSLGIVGDLAPKNFYHILFNNGAHDTVGGQPTIGFNINFIQIAHHLGYKSVISVDNENALQSILHSLDIYEAPVFLEIKVRKGSREDLGRPTTTPIQNKESLMDFLIDRNLDP
ncbi:phosphonopyruvate decarboxylase [Hoylesella saccharolytica]|uniref:phosphonopyruvate decarboxylase n=1 Tax=Hoylesella saccharolytica TaxID=633701 RepID=UPI0028D1E359|nr:phosphonopyruvate decarboxylase [Hoylesella saccharolytica]